MLRRFGWAALAAVGLASVCADSARADMITYTIQGKGQVTLGATVHDDVDFTIAIEADTAKITPDPVFGLLYLEASSATIGLSGLGVATLLEVPVINLYQDPTNLLYI